MKELQSLGLDVKVLDEDRNEVELIETSEYGNTDINASLEMTEMTEIMHLKTVSRLKNTDLPSRSSIPRMKSLSM